MKRILLVLICMFSFSGCSLLKTVIAPLTPVKNTVPQEKSRSRIKYKCSGDIKLDQSGNVLSCSKGFKSYTDNQNQTERRLNLREKIAQFITRASGYLLIGIILMVVVSMSGFGWVFSAVFSGIRGSGRALKEVVKGVSDGKRYIRNNGTNYTDAEKKIYMKSLDDLMKKIEVSQSASSKKLVNALRAKV